MIARRRWLPVFSLMVALVLGIAQEAAACGTGGGIGEAATPSIITTKILELLVERFPTTLAEPVTAPTQKQQAAAGGTGAGIGEAGTASIKNTTISELLDPITPTSSNTQTAWVLAGAYAIQEWGITFAIKAITKIATAYQYVKLAVEPVVTTVRVTQNQRQLAELYAEELRSTTLTVVIDQIEASNSFIGFTRATLKALLLQEVEEQGIDVPKANITE